MIAEQSRARNATKEAQVFRIRGREILLWQVAIGSLVVGLWAAIAPHSWFDHFPFGRNWVIGTDGNYNHHLVDDVAWALIALGILAAWAAAPRRVDPLRGACVVLVVFGLPHFIDHTMHTAGLSTGDNIVNLALLFGSWAIPAGLLAASYRPAAGRIAAERAADDPRVAPYRPSGPDVVRRGARSYMRRQFGKDVTPIDVTAHSAPIFRGYLAYEWGLQQASSVDPALSKLAEVKAASVTGCPFCIDIGSALVRKLGVPERQLLELHMHSESDAFSPVEKLVLDYAEAVSDTPVVVPDEMFAALREHFDDQQIVELTAAIAWENYRGRFNHALGIGSQGFAAGGACALPAAAAASASPA
jgi:AhpD family alkylhydroperoxidase